MKRLRLVMIVLVILFGVPVVCVQGRWFSKSTSAQDKTVSTVGVGDTGGAETVDAVESSSDSPSDEVQESVSVKAENTAEEASGTEVDPKDDPAKPSGDQPDQANGDADEPEGQDQPEAGQDTDKPAEPIDPNMVPEAINLNNIEMKHIVQKFADWTGKPVIPANDEVMKTRLTIYSTKKVPRKDAMNLIIMALQSKGIVVEELPDRIMLRPLASVRLGSVPTLGVEEPLARIEDKTQIIEKWFQLENYPVQQLIKVISPLIAEYGHVTADQSTARVAVIDNVENLMRIQRIINQLDIPESEQSLEKTFMLNHADPTEVVQLLEMILGESYGHGRNNNYRSSNRGRSNGGSNDIKTATSVVIEAGTTPIRLLPLPKQRWIIARAGRDDMAKIEEWIERLDLVDTAGPKQMVIPVKYANVYEVVRMVQRTLREMPGTDIEANLVVEALQQSSQIVVFGSEENRKLVEKLVAQIDLPKDDDFIEKTFKLQYADPDKIKDNIENLYETQAGSMSSYSYRGNSRNSRYHFVDEDDVVKVVSYPMIKQVTVIANEANLKKITDQIKEWDKPLDIDTDQYRIISLENSDPMQMAELLKKLFSEEDTSRSRNMFRYFFDDEMESKQKIVGSLYGLLTFEPVQESKKLMVISQIPEAYDVIERLVKRLDSREKAEVPKVVTLKYADAEDLCDQLNAILNESGTTATIQRSKRGLSQYDTESGEDSSATANNDNNDVGTIRPWWAGQRRDNTVMPSSNLIGRVRFVPVHRSKAVLVLSPPEYMDDIIVMIDELDRPGMQVMIKVVIFEIDLSDVTSLGVQLASDSTAFGTLGVNALTALNTLSYADSGSSFSFGSDSDVSALVDLLVKHGNGRVLNQPTLWTKDNEEAVFIKGEKVAFIDSEQTDKTNTSSTTRSFLYDNVGVTLRARPNITPEKAVDMTLNLNISQIQAELINTQNVRRNLDTTTHMIVNDGQTIMMGGILYQNDETVEQKIPLFGDLPILGGFFKHNSVTKSNNELLIFVTPHVVDDQALQSIEENHEEKDVILHETNSKLEQMMRELSDSVGPRPFSSQEMK